MFQVGDVIIYGTMGVCRVTDIAMRSFSGTNAGEEQLYYTIEPLGHGCIIHTPVDTKVFTRPVISREEAEELIDSIPTIQAEAFHSRVQGQLAEHYNASLRTHDCADLMQLTMSIYAKKQEVKDLKHKVSAVDERFMKQAEELLFGELAVALDLPKEEVPKYIASRLQAKELLLA